MNATGGSSAQTHRSARIYRGLVETQIAARAGSNYRPSIDSGTFHLVGTPAPGKTLAEVEAALLREVDRLVQETVQESEIARVLKQAKAQYAYALESASNQAYWLGMMEMAGDWRKFTGFLDGLASVTPADVRRVAQTYLQPTNSTIGWFEPTTGES
jgi:zinc protease